MTTTETVEVRRVNGFRPPPGQAGGVEQVTAAAAREPGVGGEEVQTEAGRAPVAGWARVGVVAIAVMLAGVGLVGFVNSFAAVERWARPSFGELSWTLPLGIDLAIAGFVGADLYATRRGARIPFFRGMVWVLSAITVYLNVAPEETWGGRVAHGGVVALWISVVEAGAIGIRWHARLKTFDRSESIPRARWFLAPVSTFAMWRRQRLRRVRRYEDLLRWERDRALAVAAMREEYGIWWRLRAPRKQRVLLRFAELSPEELWGRIEAEEARREADRRRATADLPGGETASPESEMIVTSRADQTSAHKSPTKNRHRKALASAPATELDPELVKVATKIYQEYWRETGRRISRKELNRRLQASPRKAGIKSDKYSLLMAEVERVVAT